MIKGSASELVEMRLREYLEGKNSKVNIVVNDVDMVLLEKRGLRNYYVGGDRRYR